jgi:uncharacterized protein YbjT (DUF2867 family)
MRVLVTGASGFAGSLLVPRLLREGHHVVAFSRQPSRLGALPGALGQPYAEGAVEVVQGDVLTGEGLARAMDGVRVAYYLIHSMERSPDAGAFAARERHGASAFAAQAARSQVQRIVYLGGLLPHGDPPSGGQLVASNGSPGRYAHGLSPHLASRYAVERILFEAIPGSVGLRASIVIGARSRSFRLLVHLVERMPVLALPSWRRFRTQPIDSRDVSEMLVSAASADVAGRCLDVGGPDVLSYGEMIERIAELMLVNRPAIRLRLGMAQVTGRLLAAIAGEQPELVLPLMGSLRADLLSGDDRAARLLGVELHSFDSAVEHALAEWEACEQLAAR